VACGIGDINSIPVNARDMNIIIESLAHLETLGAALKQNPVTRRASIKDIIEALGPPHTEIGRIEADGREVGFGHLLEPGEEVDLRPLAFGPGSSLRSRSAR